MKKSVNKTKGVVKGMPTAVLMSIAIHAGLLLVASAFIIYETVIKPPPVFEQVQQAEVKKVDVRKPRPKVKKASRPRSSRLTTSGTPSMPDLSLPPIDGIGEGLGGGMNDFVMMPEAEEFNLFGSDNSLEVGNELVGNFYSCMYDRRNRYQPKSTTVYMQKLLKAFFDNDWNVNWLGAVYKSPKKLYTTHIMFPPFPSVYGPVAFGMPNDESFDPDSWFVHYKGDIACRESGRYRFWGAGDGFMAVRIRDQVVFADTWDNQANELIEGWEYNEEDDDLKYTLGKSLANIGKWFELTAEELTNMEVLFYNTAGGQGQFILTVEKEGEMYSENDEGMKILPAFKTAAFTDETRNQILYRFPRDMVDLDSEMMFNVR